MPAPRPATIDNLGIQPQDDGLFGPESVTWLVTQSPAIALAGSAAATLQMLYPPVMRMIDQASSVRKDPNLRARRTGEYAATITFGDTEAAETAGAALRRIHSHMKAVDPETGEEYTADRPDLLLWVHNALTWIVLRAVDRWGPKLTPAEQDRYVDEQRIAARLVGIDPEVAPRTVAELDAYMAGMEPRLAFINECKWFRDLVRPPAIPRNATDFVHQFLAFAAFDLLTPEQQELYGIRFSGARHSVLAAGTALLFGAVKAKMPVQAGVQAMRAQVMAHAFGGRIRQAKLRAAKTAPRWSDPAPEE